MSRTNTLDLAGLKIADFHIVGFVTEGMAGPWQETAVRASRPTTRVVIRLDLNAAEPVLPSKTSNRMLSVAIVAEKQLRR